MKDPNRPNHITWIWKIWRERPGLIFILFVLTLLSSAVAVAYPYIIKILFDTLQAILGNPSAYPDPMAEILKIVLLTSLVGIVGLVAGFFPGVRGAMNSVFEHLVRTEFFQHVLGKDADFFQKFRTGDVVTRLTDDIYDFPKLSWFLCSGIFRAVESLSKVIFCVTAMFLIDWKLTLFSLIPVPLAIIVFYLAADKIEGAFRKNQESISAINNQLEMSFSGVRIIKAFACESKYQRFFDNALTRRFDTEMVSIRLDVVMRIIFQYIDYIAQIAVIIAGGIMAVRGEITIGTFYAFYNYLRMLIYPILDLPQLFVAGKRAFVNIDRLEEMRVYPSRPVPSNPVVTKSPEIIRFDNVSFRFPDREDNALDSVSFDLKKGERICVVGSVGSGKTTLVRTLLGLLTPTSGQVLIDGVDITGIDIEHYRSMTGYVPQDPLLFSGSIKENIEFGNDKATEADIAEAVNTSQLSEEIDSFTGGLGTLLGQRGISVSGGQKQRIAIARAIVRKPEILVFDDITASLDAANEERLMSRLRELSKDQTCVIVSHRLSSIQYVDRVIFLDRGAIIGIGTHQELLETNDAYRAFMSEHSLPASA